MFINWIYVFIFVLEKWINLNRLIQVWSLPCEISWYFSHAFGLYFQCFDESFLLAGDENHFLRLCMCYLLVCHTKVLYTLWYNCTPMPAKYNIYLCLYDDLCHLFGYLKTIHTLKPKTFNRIHHTLIPLYNIHSCNWDIEHNLHK